MSELKIGARYKRWRRGGESYPVSYCSHFAKYMGQEVKTCLLANVGVFQDGYVWTVSVAKSATEGSKKGWSGNNGCSGIFESKKSDAVETIAMVVLWEMITVPAGRESPRIRTSPKKNWFRLSRIGKLISIRRDRARF
jgi:hypothetical protein